MARQQTHEVQQGIWIDVRLLQKAGLKSHYQIEVKPGEIRIIGAEAETGAISPSEKEWDVLQSLGHDAEPGKLPNAAVDHDRYLYGKGR